MNTVTPNGPKIIELRKSKGLSQRDVAEKSKLSERLLRDIERYSKKVTEYRLNNIANSLGTKVDAIKIHNLETETTSRNNGTKSNDPSQVELREIKTGKELYELASLCGRYTWNFSVEPTLETAPIMEGILTIVNCIVNGLTSRTTDEYDQEYTHSDLFRVAKLGSLIRELIENGINTLGNTYFFEYNNKDGPPDSYLIIQLEFVANPTSSKIVRVYRGNVSYDKYDLDADIPF